MKFHPFQRILAMIMVAAMLIGWIPAAEAASPSGLRWEETDQQIELELAAPRLEETPEVPYQPQEMVRVSIILQEKPTLRAGFSTTDIANNPQAVAYNRRLEQQQAELAGAISAQVLDGQKLDVVWNLTLVGNIISANVPYGKITAIEKVPGVAAVVLETVYEPCVVDRETEAQPQMFASLGMVGSSLVWSSGYTGAGSRVAIIDTGTDYDHQSLDNGAYLYALEQNAAGAGMDFEAYLESLDLLDEQEIASVLSNLNIYEKDPSVNVQALYLNEKLPFAVNYVDGAYYRYYVDHTQDYQSEHGSHVAGIAAANRYVPTEDGYADALDTVMMAGMAPDAQIITMKVFGINGGPTDADYMAAIEDAIWLGCDAVNLSLGSAVAGNATNDYYSQLLEYMTQTDTVVVASAGNSYSWPAASVFGYLYSDDVSMDTVGAPGSYGSLLGVASVENDGAVGMAFKASGQTVAYVDNTGFGNYPMTVLDTSNDLSGTDYEYIFIDDVGEVYHYDGMDLTGKVVFCSRGSMNFADKSNTAAGLGAVATVVYNNQSGLFGMDLTGIYYANPCVSISQADADRIREASEARVTEAGVTYYTGTITIYGTEMGVNYHSEYYTMSEFSSWGVPGDLSLKPEITAPGGNIYSLYGETPYGGGSDQYELMSGTSMAAPAVTGMMAVLAQYLRENGLDTQEGTSIRKLAQSLLMSTAVPIREEATGGYYSLMKQGAGLARIDLATSASSYILVEGQTDGKVKAELGDDPDRTGVYEFSFTLHNLTDVKRTYTLWADLFSQDVFEYYQDSGLWLMDTWTTELSGAAAFTVDGKPVTVAGGYDCDLNNDGFTNVADADYLLSYVLGGVSKLWADGDVDGDGTITSYDAHALLEKLNSGTAGVTVPAGGSVTVEVELTLSQSGKTMLEEYFPNGTYVQAYVYAQEQTNAEGVVGTTHSIPVLAFYGSWSDPNMFDYSTVAEMSGNAAEKIPYMYEQTSYGTANTLTVSYGNGKEYYFGGNPYVVDNTYLPERDALNSTSGYSLVGQYFTLIRNAGASRLVISNAETGEVYYQKECGALYSAYYYVNGGFWDNVQQSVKMGWYLTDGEGNPLPEGTVVEVSMIAAPEYCLGADGSVNYEALGDGSYLTSTFTVDNTAPRVVDMDLVDTTLTVTARDNRHVAAVVLANQDGSIILATGAANQDTADTDVDVELNLRMVTGKNFLLAVYDYAGNATTYEISLDLPEAEREKFTMVDYNSGCYYTVSEDGNATFLAGSSRGIIMAAEFVDNYVFEVSNGGKLYVASDDDLNNFLLLRDLDPDDEWSMTMFLDLAYNYADGELYGLFYAQRNYEMVPYLCTIDMLSGAMNVIGELPVDVNNMTIDDGGNFYSVGYNSTQLYTYTADAPATGEMRYVGETGYYATSSLNSLAWDHDQDRLYWAYPGTLLELDPATGTPTLLADLSFYANGLFIRPGTPGDQFAPTDNVDSVELPETTSVMVGSSTTLNALVHPWTVTNKSVTWSSGNTAVAAVNADGVVTGVAEGEAVITATSVLDPTVKAYCTVEVVSPDTTLNALIWDEVGAIWWSEFDTIEPQNYTRLNDTSVEELLASATVMPDGTIYAATLDTTTGYVESELYQVDPDTLEVTLIGGEGLFFADLAPAPNLSGGALLGAYGNYLLVLDPETGFYTNFFQIIPEYVVGVAYAGSEKYQEYGFDTMVDWFYVIDTEGVVYMIGLLEQSGYQYYLTHPSTDSGVFTETGLISSVICFSSLYYDGEFLYYSFCNYDDFESELYAISTTGGREVFKLGSFGSDVYPAGGLMELDAPPSAEVSAAGVTGEPVKAEASRTLEPMKANSIATVPGGVSKVTAPLTIEPHETVKAGENTETLAVENLCAGVSGILTVEFDPESVEILSVEQNTDAFAWLAEEGVLKIAYASVDQVAEKEIVANVTFRILSGGDYFAEITQTQSGAGTVNESYTDEIHSHSYVADVVDPTCTEQGYTIFTCACGESCMGDYEDALGHDWGEWYTVEAPTCTESGLDQRDCARCGHSETETVLPNGHNHVATVTAPTCTQQGCTTHTCTECGDSYVDTFVDALGHDWDEGVVTREPTEEAEGEKTFTCHRCGETRIETIPAKDHEHSYESVVTPPTCTEGGYTTHTCACGDSYVDTYVNALGHDMGAWYVTKAPTCTETGTEQSDCSRCDHSQTRTVEAEGHDYQAVVTDPTCTQQGCITHTCSVCGDEYVDSYTDALGHDWNEGVVTREPTEEAEGEKTFTCHRCGETYIQSIPALGDHTHAYGEWEIVKEPSSKEEGEVRRYCECGEYESDVIPVLTNPFTDVKEGSYCYEPILWAAWKGITSGTSATKFSPDDRCTRGQVVTFLWRAMGKPEPTTTENPFTDVKETAFYYKAVLWAVENGITTGTGGGKFSPDQTCTRGQVVTFLWRAMGKPEPTTTEHPFRDVKETAFYYQAMLWAVENGITSGYSKTTFAPDMACTRGQVVTFLYRTLKMD